MTAALGSPSASFNDLSVDAAGIGYLIRNESATNDKLLKTTNGGSTWSTLATTPTGITFINIHVKSTSEIIINGRHDALTRPAILRSMDGGTTWTTTLLFGVGETGGFYLDSFKFNDDNNGGSFAYKTIISNRYWIYTTDGGNNWNYATDPVLSAIPSTLGFGAGQPNL